MGKFTSFLTGAGQGALAAKRYQDTKDRQEKQDKILEQYLTGDMKKDSLVLLNRADDTPVPLNQLTDEEIERRKNEAGYSAGMANGGMVQPMPQHWDKMDWQRQSFKK